ncbi:MAG: hypothetical protein KF891_11815 [Rhizobacter sp.]|nr:hypothetical protein [Rhizobacter sp.]
MSSVPEPGPSPHRVPDTEARLRFLETALSPGPGGAPVQRIETHMSWVLLGEGHVLKLKKPVRHPFLDFSTPALRERHVREECRLGRRLAPGVYLGVLALQWDGSRFELLPGDAMRTQADTVDWLVLMKRLPADRALDRMLAAGTVRPHDVARLVAVLSAFYRTAPRAEVNEAVYVKRLLDEIETSRRLLVRPGFGLAMAEALAGRVRDATLQQAGPLRRRVAEGRVVDGHGDLRPEHVYLLDPPVVIDPLEFDARLREVDVADELADLSLECAMAGHAALGRELQSQCLASLHDAPPPALLQLHFARRAVLRARLSAAHLLDDEVRQPGHWLAKAGRYLRLAGEALASVG